MEDYGLARQKLFTLKRQTLEKRLRTFYYSTYDEKATIEMLIALQVRDELTSDEQSFAHMLAGLVPRIFLNTRTIKVMRRFYLYFASYFTKKQWILLTGKLFPVTTYNEEETDEGETQVLGGAIAGLAES